MDRRAGVNARRPRRRARAKRGNEVETRMSRARRLALGGALSVALLTGTSSAEPPAARVAPYLQALGTDHVSIRFELARPASATVEIAGPTGALLSLASASRAFHAV